MIGAGTFRFPSTGLAIPRNRFKRSESAFKCTDLSPKCSEPFPKCSELTPFCCAIASSRVWTVSSDPGTPGREREALVSAVLAMVFGGEF
jgi:hypothetical protein